ncbi:MAG: class I SAM-dependent methyltransferase [Candidatus Calescibacterium sp.]|jgi:2-polyprenyl-3-methyl-5-hydroxy-6-metoxy-1,4-benzoquinol methylase
MDKIKVELKKEKIRQEKFSWDRSQFRNYNSVLAYFQAQSVLENAKGDSILDLACGDGTITRYFCKKFKRVVGVDASKRQLQKARKVCPEAEFYESLIETFYTEEKFDTVTLLCVLEHVKDPVFVLKKASSFLKEDGVLIVHVPNALAVNRRIAKLMGTLRSEYELSPYDIKVAGHRRSYDMDLLLKDIRKAGLKVIKTGGIFYKMLSTPQMDWLLRSKMWEGNRFGWGRVGGPKKDWRFEFCRACYEFGKSRPEECNVIYACCRK